jgi:hypothetical protein
LIIIAKIINSEKFVYEKKFNLKEVPLPDIRIKSELDKDNRFYIEMIFLKSLLIFSLDSENERTSCHDQIKTTIANICSDLSYQNKILSGEIDEEEETEEVTSTNSNSSEINLKENNNNNKNKKNDIKIQLENKIFSTNINQNEPIPSTIKSIFEYILEKHIKTVGIFKISVSYNIDLQNLKELIENGNDFDTIKEYEFDIHAYTSVIKLWLKELKESPIPYDYFDDIIKITSKI